MQAAFIGVGETGGRIVAELLAADRRATDRRDPGVVAAAFAVADDAATLAGLDAIPAANRLHVTAPPGGRGGRASALDDRDPGERAAAAVRNAQGELVEVLTGVVTRRVDAVFVVADLADGAAGGGAAALARILRRLFEAPVVGLAVLPPAAADAGSARSAVRSLATLDREAHGVVLVDPDVWVAPAAETAVDAGEAGTGSSEEATPAESQEPATTDPEEVATGVDRPATGDSFAAAVAARVGALLRVAGGSEADVPGSGTTPRLQRGAVADALLVGGAVAVGVAEERVGGAGGFGGPVGDADPDADRVGSLVGAALDDLSLDCDVTTADAALVAVAAAPVHLDSGAVGRAKRRLVAATGDPTVAAGGCPTPGSDRIAAVVVVAGLADAPRLVALREAALAVGRPSDGSDEARGREGDSPEDDAAGGE